MAQFRTETDQESRAYSWVTEQLALCWIHEDRHHDRVSGTFEMPDLADTITQRAAEQSLGVSWDPT